VNEVRLTGNLQRTQDKGDEIGLSDYFELSAKTGSDEQIAAPFLRLVTLLED